ncbi:unnamed protein product [Diamesa serratosioi]
MKSIIWTLFIVAVHMVLADPIGNGSRIASGTSVLRSEVPELCAIDVDFENKYMICSCVIMNADWIMTSLHCVYDVRELFGTVYVTAGSQKAKGIRTVAFAEFQTAFVKLDRSFYKSDTLDFAQLPSTMEDSKTNINKPLLVCGYGIVDNKRTRYVEPQCTQMYMKNPDVCGIKTNAAMLCGNWDNKDNNVCIGDFGGPAYSVSTDSNKRHTLIGISTYSTDIRPNANCLDGHKSIYYHSARFGKDILLSINDIDTRFIENTLVPIRP